MGYVPGSHRWGRDFNAESWVAHRAYWPGAEGEAVPAIEEDEAGWGVRYVETSPGDVIVHHYKTLHGATGNISATSSRRAATFRYLGPDMRYREQPVGKYAYPHQEHRAERRRSDDWPRVSRGMAEPGGSGGGCATLRNSRRPGDNASRRRRARKSANTV